MSYWDCLNDLEGLIIIGRDLGREDSAWMEIEIQPWRLWFQKDTVKKTKEMKL